MCRRDCFERFQPFFVALALALTVASHAGAAAMYRVTDLGPNDYYGLNDLGQAIGRSGFNVGDSPPHQFIASNGQTVDLGPSVFLVQTNASGQMLQGNLGHDASGHPTIDYLIREPNGATHPIAAMPVGDYPLAINDAGQVLVSTSVNYAPTFSVLTEGQRQILLTTGGITKVYVSAFGPHGEISGTMDYGLPGPYNNTEAFIVSPDKSYTAYGNKVVAYNDVGGYIVNGTVYGSRGWMGPHYSSIHAEALNNSGVAVGYSLTPDGLYRSAAILAYGIAADLNTLIPPNSGVLLAEALKINNLGQILATGSVNGEQHSFLLTPQPAPVPEPSSWLIAGILAVLGGCGIRRCRRSQGHSSQIECT